MLLTDYSSRQSTNSRVQEIILDVRPGSPREAALRLSPASTPMNSQSMVKMYEKRNRHWSNVL